MSSDSHNASAPSTTPSSSSGQSPRLTRNQFNQQLWRAIIPPLVLLAAHAAIVTVLFLFFLRASGWARHTEQVLGCINDVERLLVNMETGYRGLLLTGEDQFMDPYRRAQPRVEPAIARLRELTSDVPAQTQRVDRIQAIYHGWVATERELPTVAVTGSLPQDVRSVITRRKILMDQAREQLREMSMAESELKRTRYNREERAATMTLLGGIGLSVSLGLALALINRRTVMRLSGVYQHVMNEEAAAGRQFMDLAETIPQLIWIADGSGRHTFFNRPWSEVTGKTRDELSTDGWLDTLHPEDVVPVRSKWSQSVSSGEPFEGEYRLKQGNDGTYRWFLCRAIPVVDADGRRTKWFGSCTDIESQKQIAVEREKALATERAARSDLLRQNRTKDEFLATLSHELRTPMTAILGWAKLLRDPTVRATNLDRAIDAIDANARAQARLIEDLLDMSRINAGKLVLKIELVDLIEVVRAAIDSVSPAAANKKVTLHFSSSGQAGIQLTGDPSRLQQVMWNLLTNAVKFTPIGGRVDVKVVADDCCARVTVSDTGRGIDSAFLPHVFQRFRQADGSTTRQHGGLGLGLAIVQHLVEMHGGTVQAASDGVGKGATFTVELPVTGPTMLDAKVPPRVSQGSVAGKRILLVDDDRDSAAMIGMMLEGAGCRVTIAHGAIAALDLLQEKQFDAMISDIGMPDIDGYGLIRMVRKLETPDQQRLPAIALTAFARVEDREAALASGFQLHVAKPVMSEDLIHSLATVLSSDRTK